MDGNVHYIYGQAEYATEAEAKDAALPQVPGSIQNAGAAYLATIVSQEGDTSIANRLYDVRPNLDRVFGFGTNGTTGVVADHGSLTGLLDDDHPQYLKTDGSRAMTGDLNLGNNSIFGVNNLTMAGLIVNNSSSTPQARVGYDNSNYYTTSVSSTGHTTFDTFGSSQGFTFIDPVTFNGDMTVQGNMLGATVISLGDAITDKITFNGSIQGGSPFVFEGVTDDSFETTLAIADPTADRTVTLPDASGEVSLLGQSIESSEITDGTIVAADLGSIPINTLSDVDTSTSSPSNGQVLSWDGSNWVPSDNEEENIYSADGTLAGNRNVAFGGNNLAFDTNKFFIDGTSGNVGVGTASPTEKLEVSGNIRLSSNSTIYLPGNNSRIMSDLNTDQLHIGDSNIQGYFILPGTNRGSTDDGSVLITSRYDSGVSSDADIKFRNYDGFSISQLMIIKRQGDVGIGTTSPSDKLHVAGSLRVEGAFKDNNNSAGTAGQVLTATASGFEWKNPVSCVIGGAKVQANGTVTSSYGIVSSVNRNNVGRYIINFSQSLNTSDYYAHLSKYESTSIRDDVNIDISAYNTNNLQIIIHEGDNSGAAGNYRDRGFSVTLFDTNCSALSPLANSDKRLKTDIENLDSKDSLEKVLALQGVRYN